MAMQRGSAGSSDPLLGASMGIGARGAVGPTTPLPCGHPSLAPRNSAHSQGGEPGQDQHLHGLAWLGSAGSPPRGLGGAPGITQTLWV